jgi:hypothetical protein
MSHFTHHFSLPSPVRLEEERTWGALLDLIRLGELTGTEDTMRYALETFMNSRPQSHTEVRLYATKAEALAYTHGILHAIKLVSKVDTISYYSNDVFSPDSRSDLETFIVPHRLELARHCSVMLMMGRDHILTFGTMGTVVGFARKSTWLGEAGERGPTESCRIVNISFDDDPLLPVVDWRTGTGTTRTLVSKRTFRFRACSSSPALMSRAQLPLVPAHAFAIEDVIGWGLNTVTLVMPTSLKKGAAYIALSRCKTKSQLRVEQWDSNCVNVDEDAVAWYMCPFSKGIEETKAYLNGLSKETGVSYAK